MLTIASIIIILAAESFGNVAVIVTSQEVHPFGESAEQGKLIFSCE
jgi:hypothetical protein